MSSDDLDYDTFQLTALSPLDGRYVRETEPLREYWSEFAYIRGRVRVEVEYLIALSNETLLIRRLSETEQKLLRSIATTLTVDGARQIKAIEQTTRHDVKSIDYFLRSKLASTSLSDLIEWIHFGLTSEDVNQTAQALALRDSRDALLLPALDALIDLLAKLAHESRNMAMLGRTHGQVAVPTTLGKEIAAFLSRLKGQREILLLHRFEAKLSGAVGNFNALAAVAPEVDWLEFSARFIRSLGLEPNMLTTQLLPYDNWVRFFDALKLTNSILLDLAQDTWRYIGDDYLTLKVVGGEVGSSTMPQKVNPIDMENAEGNLGIANALFTHYASKLPVTRLQRDLSDSTVRRTFGVALGHTLLAWLNLTRGFKRVQANEPKMREALQAHWEVLAEGAQTILRAGGATEAYETLKSLTRGQVLSQSEYLAWVEGLDVDEPLKVRLRALTPFSYIGLAADLVDRALANSDS